MMEKYEIQKLRELPIEKVAKEMGMKVEHHKALCPFHDDHHASLTFNKTKNSCRCYVCMRSSIGTIDLAMRYLGKDFPAACRWLAEEHQIQLEEDSSSEKSSSLGGSSGRGASSGSSSGGFSSGSSSGDSSSGDNSGKSSFDASRYARFFEHPWLNQAARRFLFEERKIDWRVVNWCRLTSWTDKKGINWLQIPYFDTEGRLIGIQNRNLDYTKKKSSSGGGSSEGNVSSAGNLSSSGGCSSEGNVSSEEKSPSEEKEQDAPRFRFPYGARCSIYNLPVVKRLKPGERLFITEGCSDCWAMLSAGHKAIAIPSATLLKPEDKQLLTDIGRLYQVEFHMFPDQDVPGESLFMQLREMLPQLVHHQLPPGCKDFSEYYLLGAVAPSGSKEPKNK
ncbi:CHC2 zinc finger domain-containing protein [Segatella copri]|uniref:CHC2 zinc finger domain-containing protein n=1 Tax=Segatella copri TaxID=165179 RepID=UPI002FF1408F